MNPSLERIVTKVRRLLESLNEENYESMVNDLAQYFDNGTEESILLVETCLKHFDSYEDKLGTTDVEPAIASLFRILMEKPHFSMVFSGLMIHRSISGGFFENLSTALKLSASEKVAFGFTLLDSEINDVKIAGKSFCMSQCEELCGIHGSLATSADDILKVLRFLEQSEVHSKHVDSFMLMILQAWLNAHSHVILADSDKRKLLSEIDFQIKGPFEIKKEKRSQLFARLLGSWNQLSYRCGELRVEGVQLRADVAFSLLMSCYRNACQDPFPLAAVCGNVWKNTESQLLFLKHAVSSPPEVFTFAHCKRQLEYADHKFQHNHASQPWLCVDLLDVLCQLAEKGHTTSVRSLLEFPLKNFPEVLLLGMAHVTTPYNLLQHEVFSTVLPLLFKDASMNRIILRLWHVNSLLFSRALNDALNLDLENMNRAVDVFHELKILLSVLDLVPMSLEIRLAVLASRKDFIHLVEWLSTNLSASEDIFFKECQRFLKEVEEKSGKIWTIYKETAPTFSKVLQMHTDLLSSNKLTEKMESLYVTCVHSPKMDKSENRNSLKSELHADVKSEMPGSYSPFTGSDGAHLHSQVVSQIQLQQMHESYKDKRHKNSSTFSSQTCSKISTSARVSVTSTEFGSAISIKTLLAASGSSDTSIEAPPPETQDKILFIINNLSAVSIEARSKEFIEILEERFYTWFAKYLVIKRASMEPNFHMLYINLLEKCNSKQLIKKIVQETYDNCKVLLSSELIKSSVEERKLLKNLGGWLGKLTVGRNQVLLAKQIDPKSLIMKAYEKGLMIGVLPFTSKILESCKNSIAYQLPNTWTMEIIELLAEIHAMPYLKANLQFEIEVLFKNLDLDMKSVTPTSLLKDKIRIAEGNPDFSRQQIVEEVKSTVRSDANQDELSVESAGPSYQGGLSHIIYQDAGYLHLPVLPLVLPDQLSPAQVFPVAQLPYAVPASPPNIPEYQIFFLTTHFQSLLPVAMAKATNELISTIVQRSVSIATQTTIELVLKEYYTELDENYIHSESCLIVVCLAGNLSYVTCKEPLRSLISTELQNSVEGLNVASEIFENTLQHVIDENIESGCEFIEKAATEKGLTLVKRELTQKLSVRRMQREGYNRFTSKVIGPSFTTGTALEKFQILLEKLEIFIANNAKETEIQVVISEIHAVIIKCICKDEAALAVAQKVFDGLYENETNSTHVNACLAVLVAICDVSQLVGEELTSWVIYADDDRKFNKHITVGLIHSGLLNLTEYDVHVGKLIEAEKNRYATEFSLSLIKTLKASDARVISQLHNIVDALVKVINYHVAGNDDKGELKSSQPDPPEFNGQVSKVLAEWCQIRDCFDVNDATCAIFVLQLHRHVFSKADDMPDRFFYLLLELVVSHCQSSEGTNPSSMQFHQEADPSSFHFIDVYTDLIFSILKFHPVDHKLNKLSLLSKMLMVIERFITKDATEKKASFSPRPYFRLFINFLHNLGTLASVIKDANFQVLTSISYSFHSLQPAKIPEFSYAWLELVCHEDFMQKLLNEDDQKGWPYFLRLLVDLLQFVEPFLTIGELTEPVLPLYEGTLRVLLVLSHDFPEFLCNYHFSLCDVIAPHCLQLRNIILTATPRNMRNADPNTPNLKVDLLTETTQPPCILSEFDAALKSSKMKSILDEYLMTMPEDSSFLSQLKYRLLLPSSEAERSGTRYNVPLMNSLVLYVGIKALQKVLSSTIPHATSIGGSVPLTGFFFDAALNIFQTLVRDLDYEGRYLFFNSVANQLRYPNTHTHYFSFIMLHIFSGINQEAVQEQITRVLLQLLINRPHPWGALATFLELTKNPCYNFWNLCFTKCDPEIKRIFNSVSRFSASLNSGEVVDVPGVVPDNML